MDTFNLVVVLFGVISFVFDRHDKNKHSYHEVGQVIPLIFMCEMMTFN